MKKSKRLLSLLLSTAAALSLVTAAASSEDIIICGDVNNDKVLNEQDISLFSDNIIGRSQLSSKQLAVADINNDGRINVYDLILLKKNIFSKRNKLPSGTWLAYEKSGTKYYTFGKKKCTCTDERTGKVTELDCSVSGNKLTIGKTEYDISWNSSDNFVLKLPDGTLEEFRYYDSSAIDYSSLLTGNWYAKSGSSVRCFNIKGVSGSVNGESFIYKIKENSVEFIFKDGKILTARMAKVDSMHMDMKWSTGMTERFTLRNVSVKDGITYINGILIANKSYSLPSTYNPGAIIPEAMNAFYNLQSDGYKAGLNYWITSGYRSYATQKSLYDSYCARDGKARADTYSARPGYSEHQTGLAMDINVAGDNFGYTPESKWLAANCWKYGFIIRYPQGKQDITGYKYEPWHVRYLGKELAKEVYESGLTLEEFLCIDSKYKN